ncbi:MAG: tetratricopeptide repeat protein [Xanthomonadales bacterium]|nr:tetratricopeptide repeat protein [Xanthomonadales bacterium]
MHPLLILSAILQIGCVVHVVRTGRPMYWIFLLFIGSYIAIAAYLIAEVLPGLGQSRTARRALRGAQDRIDPERRKREATRQLDVADTLDNRRRLAQESFNSGDYQQAAELYRSGLRGLYATDPELMLGLARSQFALNLNADARQTLDELIAANPDFRSDSGHLLYARCLEALGDIPAAIHEYEALVDGFTGEEARVRFGLLLKREGRAAQASEVFSTVLKRSRVAPKYYQREQREWIDIATREAK